MELRKGFRSGVRGGHSTGPLRPTQRPGNVLRIVANLIENEQCHHPEKSTFLVFCLRVDRRVISMTLSSMYLTGGCLSDVNNFFYLIFSDGLLTSLLIDSLLCNRITKNIESKKLFILLL